ncbi:19318_t:CDS:10 [Entrophospora sp. SA101]|nr:19313_t:CDS:10 [Entrophospora sp. SA101]CAJ0879145.1 19318_t:CDS:10 [Entrophospora sp. SA101]
MAKEKTTKKSTTTKKLTPYNKFMKTELPKVKAENPDLPHKDAFKLVAERWKNSTENPKNASTILKPLSKTKLNNIQNLRQFTIKLEQDGAGTSVVFDQNSEGPIVKNHWQPYGDNDTCSISNCRKSLNILSGKNNCRNHCKLTIKLSKQAQHDPINGTFFRVCDDCFVSREGYFDNEGVMRSHTEEFNKHRTKIIERAHLEENRLEKRLEKLTKLYASQNKNSITAKGVLKNSIIISNKNQRRLSEQSVVKWEDDASVANCPLYSSEQISVGEVRVCKKCRSAVLRRKEYNEEISKTPPVIMLYQKLTKIRSAIDLTLPKFQDMIVMLKSQEIVNQTHADYQVAAKTRKELLDNFAQFDAISKEIKTLTPKSESVKRLQLNIHLAASQYLHQNMLTLSVLPQMFKRKNNSSKGNGNSEDDESSSVFSVFSANNGVDGRTRSFSNSSVKKVGEKLDEQLEVLQQQEKLVLGYIQDATRRRKIDDVKTLKASLDELKAEINRKKAELSGELYMDLKQ